MAKYKMKTNSSAKKRFKLTANGRVKRKQAFLRHNLGAKSTSAKRKLRRGAYVSKTDSVPWITDGLSVSPGVERSSSASSPRIE